MDLTQIRINIACKWQLAAILRRTMAHVYIQCVFEIMESPGNHVAFRTARSTLHTAISLLALNHIRFIVATWSMNDVIRRLRRLCGGSLYLLTCAVGKIYAPAPPCPNRSSLKVNPGRPFGRTLLKIRRRLLCLSRRRENYFPRGHLLLARMIDCLSSIIVRLC